MAYKEFVYSGVRWRAWDTLSTEPQSVRPALRAGWVTFESETDGERRRLAPVPAGWERFTEARLGELCDSAFHVAPSLPKLPGLALRGLGAVGKPQATPDAEARKK